jgi:tRNA (guanine6-N2)-methyltransferase
MQFFATTFHGLEDVAAAEISFLLPSEAHADVGKVFFSGLAEDCARVNYACKTVNRVFLLLLSEEVGGLEDIRRVSASVDYTDYIGRSQSFAVRADRVGVHPFTSLDIAASVGQAVIESFQTATGVRLKVDLSNPDVEIYALLRDSEFLLGVNTTGESLHRRFYRRGYHRAALSPTVANSMVRLSGLEAYTITFRPVLRLGNNPARSCCKRPQPQPWTAARHPTDGEAGFLRQ